MGKQLVVAYAIRKYFKIAYVIMICITSLEENEDANCTHIIQQLLPSNDR